MRIFIDTSIIVEIERKDKKALEMMEKLDHSEVLISAITVAEILTGSYLTRDFKSSALEAKKILGQFIWVDFDGGVAEKTGQLLSILISAGSPVSFQDTGIAASFLSSRSDFLVTLNKKDFMKIPGLEGKVFSPAEFLDFLKKGK